MHHHWYLFHCLCFDNLHNKPFMLFRDLLPAEIFRSNFGESITSKVVNLTLHNDPIKVTYVFCFNSYIFLSTGLPRNFPACCGDRKWFKAIVVYYGLFIGVRNLLLVVLVVWRTFWRYAILDKLFQDMLNCVCVILVSDLVWWCSSYDVYLSWEVL